MAANTNPKDALGIKKSALRLVPPALTISVAPVMALGARKYGPYNWRETPVKLSVYLEAMLRHVYAAMDGEDLDSESGEPHLAHVAASVGIVLDAAENGTLIDDRPIQHDGLGAISWRGPAAELLDRQDQTAVTPDPTSMTAMEAIAADGIGQDSIPVTEYHFSSERPHAFFERHEGPSGSRAPGIPPHRHESDGRLILYSDKVPAPEARLPLERSPRFQDLEGIGGSEL